MNDLSWMLYWADVLPSFSSAMAFFLFFAVVGFGGALVANRVFAATKDHDADAAVGFQSTSFARWAFPLIAIIWLSMWFVPSRDTFYAIAASEMGEEALKSPIATKAGKALEKWLDDQLADETKGE